MSDMLTDFAQWIAASPSRVHVADLMRQVPSLAPILQTIHLLSVAAVMASIVMVDLRVLGLAAPSQKTDEMLRRLMPWTWGALVALLLSGVPIVLVKPVTYASNPVFRLKFLLLIPAVALAIWFYRRSRREPNYWGSSPRRIVHAKAIAALSLLLWLGVVLAGRWIAYAYVLSPR